MSSGRSPFLVVRTRKGRSPFLVVRTRKGRSPFLVVRTRKGRSPGMLLPLVRTQSTRETNFVPELFSQRADR
jgi:hypothetical protein